MTDFIVFAALFSVYAVMYTGMEGGVAAKDFFDLRSALASTLILLTGSFSCGMALLAIPPAGPKRSSGSPPPFFWEPPS